MHKAWKKQSFSLVAHVLLSWGHCLLVQVDEQILLQANSPCPFSILFLQAKLGECIALWFALTPPPLKWLTEQKNPFEVCKHTARYNEFSYKYMKGIGSVHEKIYVWPGPYKHLIHSHGQWGDKTLLNLNHSMMNMVPVYELQKLNYPVCTFYLTQIRCWLLCCQMIKWLCSQPWHCGKPFRRSQVTSKQV